MSSAFENNVSEKIQSLETCYKKLYNLFCQYNYTPIYQISLGTLYCIKQYRSLRLIQQLLIRHKIKPLLFAFSFNLGQRAERPVLAIGLNLYEVVSMFQLYPEWRDELVDELQEKLWDEPQQEGAVLLQVPAL